MATFDYTLTDADIGRVLPITNGFLVTLTRTKAGPYEVAQWSEGKQQWLTDIWCLEAVATSAIWFASTRNMAVAGPALGAIATAC